MNKQTQESETPHGSFVLVALITAIVLIPFVTKAFHIDDTLFLWTAKQIQAHPLDFYGFNVNWYGYEAPMWEITKNPPLASYLIAFVAWIIGWSEIALHLAFLIPALAVSIGSWHLARYFCRNADLAALTAVLTPAFPVSSTNIMSDTLMLAFYVWAAVFWLKGAETERSAHFLLSALFITLAALTKYFGITMVPLLLVFTLARFKKARLHLLYLLIPVIVLVVFEWASYKMYGVGLIGSALAYPATRGTGFMISRFITGLAFTGGCLISVMFVAPFIWSRRALILGVALSFGIVVSLVAIGRIDPLSFWTDSGVRWAIVIQMAIFVVVGTHLMALTVVDLAKNKDALSLMLFLWVVGTFLFATFVNWAVTGRTILPMAPAAGILVARALESRYEGWKSSHIRRLGAAALIPAAIVSLAVTWADFSWANSQRTAAQTCKTKLVNHKGKIWFQGHWGYQYYMERFGALALDFNQSVLAKDDIMIMPANNSSLRIPPESNFVLTGHFQLMPCSWLSTQQVYLGGAFYSSEAGPMPFVFGPVDPETYLFYRIRPSNSENTN